jgi:hypothetical protein
LPAGALEIARCDALAKFAELIGGLSHGPNVWIGRLASITEITAMPIKRARFSSYPNPKIAVYSRTAPEKLSLESSPIRMDRGDHTGGPQMATPTMIPPMARGAAMLALAATLAGCATEPKNRDTITVDAAMNGQSATVGTRTVVRIHVTDKSGAAVTGTIVSWTVINHAGSTLSQTVATDQTGAAAVTWTLDTIARIDSLTASVQGAGSATITATGTAGAISSFTKVSGDNQTIASGLSNPNAVPPLPLVVRLADRYGNGIAAAPVSWTTSCTPSFNGGLTTGTFAGQTDASGKDRVAVTFPIQATRSCPIQASITSPSIVLTFNLAIR